MMGYHSDYQHNLFDTNFSREKLSIKMQMAMCEECDIYKITTYG